jgi:uncharacterized protein (DUF2141 family)
MVDSVTQARQWFSLHRITAAFVVVICLAGPVAGTTGGAGANGLSTEANGDSIGLTESGVHAQTGPLVAANGSVTINETRTNRTQAVLDSVTLPRNGYIVAQTGNVSANQSGGTVVGHTQYVRNGTFNDVILNLNKSVRGSKTLSVALYNDTNGDKTLNTTGNGTTDTPYQTSGGAPVHDTVRLGSEQKKNSSQSQNTTSTNATVAFSNQTANGSTITVKRATLPEGGFVVLSDDPYEEIGYLRETMIAVSQPLSPGIHRNVTLNVTHSPAGGYQNQTALNTTSDYSVGLFRDTNNNSHFDYITSAGVNDTAYLTGTGKERRYASDAASITIPGSNTPTPTASIRFRDQSTTGASVTVDSVTLPRGGYIVVHNASYLRGGDPLQTVIGHSPYLPAGTHRNVTVQLTQAAQNGQAQTLVAIPAQDTDNNRTYGYVQSDGFRDVPYTDSNGAITDRASVTGAATETTARSSMTATTTTASEAAGGDTGGGDTGGGSWFSTALRAGVAALMIVGGYLVIRRA